MRTLSSKCMPLSLSKHISLIVTLYHYPFVRSYGRFFTCIDASPTYWSVRWIWRASPTDLPHGTAYWCSSLVHSYCFLHLQAAPWHAVYFNHRMILRINSMCWESAKTTALKWYATLWYGPWNVASFQVTQGMTRTRTAIVISVPFTAFRNFRNYIHMCSTCSSHRSRNMREQLA